MKKNNSFFVLLTFFVLGSFLFVVPGCNSGDSSPGAAATQLPSVAIGGRDSQPDGKISDTGLQQIAKISEKPFEINFIRTNLSDAGLGQLAQYKNLKKVNAIGSNITKAGIDKLKAAIPDVEVNK